MATKIAFIGTHGVGKTTLTYGLAARLKSRDLSLEVIVEVARRCPLPLNRETTRAAQAWILHTQIADELAAEARYPLILCDRSVLDNYTYLLVAEGRDGLLEGVVGSWLHTYALLVHVPVIEGNGVTTDGVRSSDPSFQALVEKRLNDEMERRDLPVLRLDPTCRDRWLEEAERACLEIVKPPQLELL